MLERHVKEKTQGAGGLIGAGPCQPAFFDQVQQGGHSRACGIKPHRHGYSCHTDANGFRYCVDGGSEYLRRTLDKDAPPAEDASVYSDDPHEMIRDVMRWGTRGMDGSEPVKYLLLKDMTSAHIQACLDTQYRMLPAYRVAMQNELNHRKVTW